MARRSTKPPQRSAPKRIVRTIRTSNYYLKIFLAIVFVFLLGAVSAYRFLQRLPVNNLETDLQSNQIALSASAQPSIQPEGSLFTTPDPNGSIGKPESSVKPAASQSPSATPKSSPKVSPSPTPKVVASPTVVVKPTPAAPPQSGSAQTGTAQSGKTYTVQKGDSLWKIAQSAYGDPYKWTQIYAANKKLVGSNPGLLFVGTQLTLP